MSEHCKWLHEQLEQLPLIKFPFKLEQLPDNGIYFFYEKGEIWGHGGDNPRVVRIGTHKDGNFRSRIKEHFLLDKSKMSFDKDKPKPSDRSIFRKNIGRALLNRDRDDYLQIWEIDFTTRGNRESLGHKRDVDKEKRMESTITRILRERFSFRFIVIDSQTERMGSKGLESSLIGTVASCKLCNPSDNWLGNKSPKQQIKKSGLWLVQHLKANGINERGDKRVDYYELTHHGTLRHFLPESKAWVATVVLQSNENYSNKERMSVLSEVVESVFEKSSGEGIILSPGGMFSTGENEPKTYYNEVEGTIKSILSKTERNIVVCAGIDGSVDEEGYSHDQIAIAVSKKGIDAIGRKFHPAPQEKEHVKLADDASCKEDGKSRIFTLNGIKYYMCVCYDSYGIRQKNLTNPDVDIVLNLVHCFYPRGESPSGESYFARHGFAGASKQWSCPTFGAAVFFNREIPERWPTGVYWNQCNKSTTEWKYEDNPLKYSKEFKGDISEGIALVRIY